MSPVVIINPVAGTGGRRAVGERVALARQVFRSHGAEPRVIVTEGPHHAFQIAREARQQQAPVVAAWGGDGTVNEVASALAFGQTPLAVVAAGSGNGFARDLGLPRRADRALTVAALGVDRRIDVGELAGRFFVNMAGIGFDALVAEHFNNRPRGRRGLVPYVLGALGTFSAYAPLDYHLTLGGRQVQVRAVLIAIANGRQYGRGAAIVPDARIDDGVLDVLAVEPRSFVRALWDSRRLFFGTMLGAAGVTRWRLAEGTVRADHGLVLHVDGEAFRVSGPVPFAVHAGALRVRVPRP